MGEGMMCVLRMALLFSSLSLNEGHAIANCTGVSCPAGSYVDCSLDCRYNCGGGSAQEQCQKQCDKDCQCRVPPCDAPACDPSKDFPCGCTSVCWRATPHTILLARQV